MRKFTTMFFLIAVVGFASSQTSIADKIKNALLGTSISKDTIKKTKPVAVQQEVDKYIDKDAAPAKEQQVGWYLT